MLSTGHACSGAMIVLDTNVLIAAEQADAANARIFPQTQTVDETLAVMERWLARGLGRFGVEVVVPG